MKFIKDSIRELKHVVWPTREESIKYFTSVVTILVLFGVYLFIFSSIFSKGLLAIKNFVNPTETEIIKPEPIQIISSTGEISTGKIEISTGDVLTGNTVENSTGEVSTGNTSN